MLGTGGYLGFNIFGSFLGYVISAHLSDWLGRRKTFVIMACAAAVVVPSYTLLPLSDTAVLLLGFPLGFFQSGIIAGMGATFAELFPTRVRATGQGFSYNTGRAVGSLVPALVGVLAASLGLGTAMGSVRRLRLHARPGRDGDAARDTRTRARNGGRGPGGRRSALSERPQVVSGFSRTGANAPLLGPAKAGQCTG